MAVKFSLCNFSQSDILLIGLSYTDFSLSDFLLKDVSPSLFLSMENDSNCISVKFNESELIILGCYRPYIVVPTEEEFVTDLSHVFNNPNLVNKKVMFLRNLNINLINENSAREHFMNFMQSYYFFTSNNKINSVVE